jgi:biopolymer transport protein ExbD
VDSQLVLSIAPTTCPIVEPPVGESVPADCHVTLNDEQIPASELSARVAQNLNARPADQHVLFLAADDSLNYEGVLRIIDLAKSGVEDLKIEFVATQ